MIIFTETNTVFTDEVGNLLSIPGTHANFESINVALRSGNIEEAQKLADVEASVKKAVSASNWTGIEIIDGEVYYNGAEVGGYVIDKMLDLHAAGMDYLPLKLFIENLFANPNKSSIDELFSFLEFSSLPITEDGCFVAYKKVRSDFLDIHSGTFDNSVGKICEMPREDVNPNRNQTCSSGLHFCSKDYLQHFGSSSASSCRIVLIKINPKDVVSIPSDYNNTKGRCARYEVVEDVTSEFFEYGKDKYAIADGSPVYSQTVEEMADEILSQLFDDPFVVASTVADAWGTNTTPKAVTWETKLEAAFRNYTTREIAHKTGFTVDTVRHWKNKSRTPSLTARFCIEKNL